MKRQSKYQNQSEIWKECCNYQPREFKKTVIYLLKALVEKVENTWEMEILRKNQKQMLETEKTVAEMENAFDALVSRLNNRLERCLLDILLKMSKAENNTVSALKPQWN